MLMKSSELLRNLNESINQNEWRINNLETQLKNHLNKYMKEDEKDHKWIIISSLFLTYIKELPMHPIDKLKINIVIKNNKKIYYCPYKSDEGVCKYCVCRPKS